MVEKTYLPYLALLEYGELRESKANRAALMHMIDLGWCVRSSRSGTVSLTDLGKSRIPTLLNNLWPGWTLLRDRLKGVGEPTSWDGIKNLMRKERVLEVALPTMINRKTASACLGLHSKTGVSEALRNSLGSCRETTDQVLRLKACSGLTIRRGANVLDCDPLMTLLGEISIPERVFLDGFFLEGKLPDVVFTIENLGAYVDFPFEALKGRGVTILTPGKDTVLTIELLKRLPEKTAWLHFGDLDPEGVSIFEQINRRVPQVGRRFIPQFWEEQLGRPLGAGEKQWGVLPPAAASIPILKRLMDSGLWLEQEAILLDPRLSEAVELSISKNL